MTSLGLLQYSNIDDNYTPTSNNVGDLEQKRLARNKTIKKRPSPPENNAKVSTMLQLINNSNGYETNDSEENGLVDFNPPPSAALVSKPKNGGKGEDVEITEEMKQMKQAKQDIDGYTERENNNANTIPQGHNIYGNANPQFNRLASLDVYDSNISKDLNISKEGFNTRPKDVHRQFIPYYSSMSHTTENKDQLLEKLNYMIHLLEEQKDEKTGHVMEEVILYSFLGVFMIFIVDSFARAGKYTR
jgi:hypothetical protein